MVGRSNTADHAHKERETETGTGEEGTCHLQVRRLVTATLNAGGRAQRMGRDEAEG